MSLFHSALERWIEKWLAQVVDVEHRVQSEIFAQPLLASAPKFRVLTPTVQRRIDESA